MMESQSTLLSCRVNVDSFGVTAVGESKDALRRDDVVTAVQM